MSCGNIKATAILLNAVHKVWTRKFKSQNIQRTTSLGEMKLNLCVSQWTIFIADLKKYDRIYAYRKKYISTTSGQVGTSNKNTTRHKLYWLVHKWYTQPCYHEILPNKWFTIEHRFEKKLIMSICTLVIYYYEFVCQCRVSYPSKL